MFSLINFLPQWVPLVFSDILFCLKTSADLPISLVSLLSSMLMSITVNPWFVCILVDVTTFGLFRFGDGVVGGGVIGGEGVGAGAGDGADVGGGDGVDEGGQEGPWKFSGSLDYSSSIEYTHTPENFQVPWKFPGPEKIQGPWKFSGSLEISSSPGNFQGGSLIHIGRAVIYDFPSNISIVLQESRKNCKVRQLVSWYRTFSPSHPDDKWKIN